MGTKYLYTIIAHRGFWMKFGPCIAKIIDGLSVRLILISLIKCIITNMISYVLFFCELKSNYLLRCS